MNWPDDTKYHVHVFEARAEGGPVAVAVLFRSTLDLHTGQRLRRSGARHWWVFGAGSWWAKAHDRTFDCEERWAGTDLLPARARMAGATPPDRSPLAQRIEHLTISQEVASSNLAGGSASGTGGKP